MNTLTEIKEWLRIDGEDDDNTLSSLLLSSKFIIKQSTGVITEDVASNPEALELYKLVQKLIIAGLYENRDGDSKLNPLLISMSAQLESFKL